MRRVDGGQAPRALVVDDDSAIADAVIYALEQDGFSPRHAASLALARKLASDCDVLVLDLGLPDGSGFSLLGELRAREDPPRILVLTSRDAEVDCVAALEAGADDYVTKPFSPRVVVARLRALLRRGGTRPSGSEGELPAGLIVDLDRREASFAGNRLTLTKIELDILAALAERPGRVLTRTQLVDKVWGGSFALTPRTIDSHVKGLRKKLGDAGAPDGLVETVRSVGFRLKEEG